jgi:hypothetical protein
MIAAPNDLSFALDPEESRLWDKIRRFPIDIGSGPSTFAARLAREQGWTASFTTLAIGEYRRFLLLFALEQRRQKQSPAQSGSRPNVHIVPSPAVDEVWHLHLLYTHSYWDVLCRGILDAPLHHVPADGSKGEAESLDQVYRHTLEIYERVFGGPAPSSVWPRAGVKKPPSLPYHLAVSAGRMVARMSAASWARLAFVATAVLWSLFAPEGSPARLLIPLVIGIAVVIVGLITIFAMIGPRRPKRKGVVPGEGGNVGAYLGSGCGSGTLDTHLQNCGDHSGDTSYSGGHACGGHSCGGHGCGGHGCGGH